MTKTMMLSHNKSASTHNNEGTMNDHEENLASLHNIYYHTTNS